MTHTGLSSAEVAARVKAGQSNDYEARVGRTYWQIVRDNVFNVFNMVLFPLLFIILYFREYTTAFFAGFSVVSNAFLGMIQEISAKRKLDQLAALSATAVRVYRDGALIEVPVKGVVLDDVIPVEPGDRMVVDGVLLRGDALEMDESHLTGESDAVPKTEGDAIVSGSFVVAGAGVMQATAVGRDSTINRLARTARQYRVVLTPTQRRISAIVRMSVIVMFVMTPMLVLQGVTLGASFIEVVKSATTFLTSLVPQGLVLVAILSLTVGAIRISRHDTLVQRVNAVESMANVTALCFDKTGTITHNELHVTEVIPLNDAGEVDVPLRDYVRALAYQNRTAAAVAAHYAGAVGDAPEKLDEIPFTSARKWGAVTFPDATYVLGAPERVLHARHADHLAAASRYAEGGRRVLAFAVTDAPLEDDQLDPAALRPLALVVLADRVREDIGVTLAAFRAQGVELRVISGDSPVTVAAVAREAGIEGEVAYTGDEIAAMSDDELALAVGSARVFARVEPEDKRRIVRALREGGHHVAMVGDGVNDVPALKEADLAVVMNDGAQIAKDIADIVLLNNALSTLPRALREGSSITQTIFGTTKLFLTRNVFFVLCFVFVGFMALPFPISPEQISWVTFGTINIPATLIAIEWLRPAHMARFRRDVLDYVVVVGSVGAVALAVMFVVPYLAYGRDLLLARSGVTLLSCLYGFLVLCAVFGIDPLQPRTVRPQRRAFIVSATLTVLTMASFYVRPILFEFVAPPMLLFGLLLGLFAVGALVLSYTIRQGGLLRDFWRLLAA